MILNGTITTAPFTGANVDIDIPTARIPELPADTLPIDAADLIAIYDDSEGKTAQVPMSEVRDWILTGGGGTIPPVVNGDVVEVVVTAPMAGSYRLDYLPLAGKTFWVERRGVGELKNAEYNILSSGGLELTNHSDIIGEGEVFWFHVYELSVPPPSPTASGSFIKGISVINSSITLNTVHFGTMIHVAGGLSNVVITLPKIEDAPANLIIPFETMINNTNQTKIIGNSGQLIYFGNTSQNYLYLGISETLWLIRGVDGWYVMKASEGLLNVAQPFFDYVERLNTITAKGQLVAKSAVPRLMDFISANGLLISETTWQADATQQGKFADYDSATVRLPNLQNRVFRGLNNIGSTDVERPDNTAGTLQEDKIKQLDIPIYTGGGGGTAGIDKNNTAGGTYTVPGTAGGTETRMKNIGLIPLIRI